MVKVKINEIKKAIRKRDKERRLKKAAECESKGDVLQCKGFFTKAAKKYMKAIELAKDSCAETEAGAQLKLGKLYFDKMKDYNKARIHLVDFQLLTFVVKVRTYDISTGFQQARKMMQEITSYIKKVKPKVIPSLVEQEEQRVFYCIKDINQLRVKCGKHVNVFVDYLFQNYPPKCVQEVEEAANIAIAFENPKKLRKTLLRVISYYHPDKQPLDDELNLKISEEITKHLNDYLSFKS